MSITQTYYIAASARTKLGREAGRADHNLRLLVGHANLLDSLMLELANAEREQERWFNETIQKATTAAAAETESKRIRWADTIVEDPDEDADDSSDSDSDWDPFDEDAEAIATQLPLRRIRSPPVQITTTEVDPDSWEEDLYQDEEDDEEHALTRTESHPPELVSDDDSDDESAPPSPPLATLEFTRSGKEAIATTAYYTAKVASARQDLFPESYTVQTSPSTLVEAY